jgi:hypothetical protein
MTSPPFIVLDADQSRVVEGAREPVEVRDPSGCVIAVIPPAESGVDLAAAKARASSSGPWLGPAEVRAHMDAVKEAVERGAAPGQVLDDLRRRFHSVHS